jgi:hypothetical protein
MTALDEYDRLESGGLWRSTAGEQRRDVVVSVGKATLVISDSAGRALTHWSLPAVIRINPGHRPAIFSPDVEASETLELTEDDMVQAIERVRKTVERRRARPGRLRGIGILASFAAVAAVATFWLPDAMVQHTVGVVPDVKRTSIGLALADQVERVAGRPCTNRLGQRVLDRFHARLLPDKPDARFVVLPALTRDIVVLPGDLYILNRSLLEDHETPDVAAGYILAATQDADRIDPLTILLETAGLRTTFRLLTTSKVQDQTLVDYSEVLLSQTPAKPDYDDLLTLFDRHGISSTPYAYAVDVSGETTLALIEADPHAAGAPTPVMTDSDWVSLQGICGG